MLDIAFIRENPDKVKEGIKNKNLNPDIIDAVLKLDSKRRELIQQTETIRADRNKLNEQLKVARTPELIQQSGELKQKLQDLEPQLIQVEEELNSLMLQVPGIPLEEVPVGKDDTGNVVIRTWGDIPQLDFIPKTHIELGESLDLIDIVRGSKVAGFRGYFLKNEAVMLQFALMQYTLQKFISKGYTPVVPPVILKKRAFVNTGHFPWGEKETYKFQTEEGEEETYLAGTAEVPLVSLYQDEVLNEKDLPIRLIGFSPCYRKEAGNYGKDTKGIYRVHEFVKTEQVVICKNDVEESRRLHDEMLSLTEEIAQDLKLPYRILRMCTGDMGEPQAKKYDLEAWIPSRNGYGELASDSILLDFQSRRANIRYRDANNEMRYVHMLNNTASNSPRWLVAILENYQQADGSINIPEVLVPIMGKTKISRA
ncbi:MAG TPA: serine--tRNA ligase [Candidatus Woesebacteria bacterium]|nr:serine--tRNA ligase [Candidatus Woesebacteria bacterium]